MKTSAVLENYFQLDTSLQIPRKACFQNFRFLPYLTVVKFGITNFGTEQKQMSGIIEINSGYLFGR